MYKPLICLAAIVMLGSCGSQKNNGEFELKGTLTDSKGETIYLEKLVNPQPVVVDSVVLDENGNFEFVNYRPMIGFYRIKTSQQNFAMLVLDSADKVKVTGSVKDLSATYKVEGSPETTLFMEYTDISKKRDLKMDSLNKAFQQIMESRKMDSLAMDSVSKTFEAPYRVIVDKFNNLLADKISKNTSMYSSVIFIQSLEPDKYADVYRALDAGLSKKYPNDKNVKMYHDGVNKILATMVGQPAPEIVLPSPEGKDIALSSLKGKVVLIDFWASWCGPCRKEMPNVVRAYSRFKDKGFEIYGVSLDKEKEKWVEAIKNDGITWPQVSELQYWNSAVVGLYGIEGIPYTVLLDREGKILAKNLRGAELEKKLAEVLN
jgi:thiol-disulfide isomerase/thioredoxin